MWCPGVRYSDLCNPTTWVIASEAKGELFALSCSTKMELAQETEWFLNMNVNSEARNAKDLNIAYFPRVLACVCEEGIMLKTVA